MLGLIIAVLINIGLVCSFEDFNTKSIEEKQNLQEIVIGDIDIV